MSYRKLPRKPPVQPSIQHVRYLNWQTWPMHYVNLYLTLNYQNKVRHDGEMCLDRDRHTFRKYRYILHNMYLTSMNKYRVTVTMKFERPSWQHNVTSMSYERNI